MTSTPSECASFTPEISSHPPFENYIVEFDDQGWLHASASSRYDEARFDEGSSRPADAQLESEAGRQLDHLMESLAKKMESGRPLTIIVYVHGWKHNAQSDDNNVERFRDVLENAATLESFNDPALKREIVGVYVGWRGTPWAFAQEPLISLTFWGRKAAAARVAQGSVRELFARLNSMQRYWNDEAQRAAVKTDAQSSSVLPERRVKTILVGHSFGAAILYSAVSDALIAAVTAQADLPRVKTGAQDGTMRATPATSRFADMVILLNPAFEASRYEPLFRAASLHRAEKYEPPLLVTVTSTADQATRRWFKAGRFLNSIFEYTDTSRSQRRAIINTHGHLDGYISHELVMTGSAPACDGWSDPTKIEEAELKRKQWVQNWEAEEENEKSFLKINRDERTGLLKAGWSRDFCGGGRLTHIHREGDRKETLGPNSIIWNIRTTKDVIKDHGVVDNPGFVNILRQLLHGVPADEKPR